MTPLLLFINLNSKKVMSPIMKKCVKIFVYNKEVNFVSKAVSVWLEK